MTDWYGVYEDFAGVWRITERMVNLYLVTGTARALLIDTGFGLGNLTAIVHELTPLLLTVVMTHGHQDHTTGATHFGQAAIHPNDMVMLPEDAIAARRRTVERFFKESVVPDGFDAEVWVHAPKAAFTPLAEDTVFDLGGRTVQIIATPGHTPGSICLLDETGLLFTGDTVVDAPILMYLAQSLTLRTYTDSLAKLLTFQNRITTLMPGHGAQPILPGRLSDLHTGAEAILSGKVVGTLEQSFMGPATCARFATCAICYNPERLG